MPQLPSLTPEIAVVFAVVALTVFLIATDLLRVDLTALLIMTLLGLLGFVPGLRALGANALFAGFSSNSVIALIAVMIIGGGLDRTGVMEQVARVLLRLGGRAEKRTLALVCGTAGLMSSVMMNAGVAALLIPVTATISARARVPLQRLVMPMGFCVILGGTVTMVGSSPLIMLNDLLDTADRSMPGLALPHFGLFSVAPIGLALVAAGMGYFLVAGRYVLPRGGRRSTARGTATVPYMRRLHGINAALRELEIPVGSSLVDRDVRSIQREFDAKIVASRYDGRNIVSPPMEARLAAPATIAVIAEPADLKRFIAAGHLVLRPKLRDFRYLLARSIAGIAQIVVPPDSNVIGKTVRELRLRKVHGLGLLSIVRAGEPITSGLQTVPFQAGDTLICHTRWADLARLEDNRDFVIVTADYPRTPRDPSKAWVALSLLALSLGLVLFTRISLPLALLTGAVGMVVAGALTIDQAYEAVSWRTVFLLAGLLPLGHAMQTTGAANYVALHLVAASSGVPPIALQALLAILATALTLVVSNVGATLLLVPIAINAAVATGADPAMFAMTVAISTSNSFLIPTHQVNALILAPGGYRVADFVRAGGPMTLLYLIVSLSALNLVF